MHELLNPNVPDPKSMADSYRNNLSPMMIKKMSINDLMNTREKFITTLNRSILPKEKDFLLSFKSGKPRFSLLDVEGVEKYPAVQWKQQNIQKMSTSKRSEQLLLLAEALGVREKKCTKVNLKRHQKNRISPCDTISIGVPRRLVYRK